jgi:Patatin-like phospholipase
MSTNERLISIAISLVVAALIYFLAGGRNSHPFIKVVVLTRFSALMAILQVAAALAGLGAFSSLESLLQNVFILDNGWQLCHVTWMSLLLGTAILVTWRTTKINAPYRFTDLKEAIDRYTADEGGAAAIGHAGPLPLERLRNQFLHSLLHPQTNGPNLWRKRWLYLAGLSLPIPLTAMGLTTVDLLRSGSNALVTVGLLGAGFLGGLVVWVVVMLATTLFQQVFLDQSTLDVGLFPFDKVRFIAAKRRLTLLDGIFSSLARFVSRLGPGYARLDPTTHRWRWRPGHGQLAVFAGVLVSAYVAGLFYSEVPRPHSWYSALFGLLIMMLSICIVTTGAAFLLDFFRIPLVLTLLTVSFFTWWVSGADSYYEVTRTADLKPLKLEQVAFTKLQPPKKTLVVVTAAGGGIQAAAWTAEVLTGLVEIYGNEFSDSIGVVSSVSGGSVGAMFFLDRFDDLASDDTRKKIRDYSMDSSLEATAWGWAGWDSVRTLAPSLVPNDRDRGWAVQESWRRNLAHPDDSLATWVSKARHGRFPIVVFNATAAENGKRMVMSNVALPEPKDRLQQTRDAVKAIEFFKSSEGFDISIATAARLSATFPYVSPISRPSAPVKEPFHLADGGYVDNEGMVSALEWLRHLVALRGSLPAGTSFDRVLLVRIVPFPPEAQEDAFSRLGWLQMFSGPIDTMMNVRSTSQVERNQIALQLTEDVLKARQGQPELRVAQFQFRNAPDDKKGPPLSWRLSLTQKAAVKSAWRAIVAGRKDADNPLHIIGDWFVVKP